MMRVLSARKQGPQHSNGRGTMGIEVVVSSRFGIFS